MKNSIYILFALVIFSSSCQEVIDLELPEGRTRLVIDGGVSNLENQIKLSYTAPYFAEGETPPATDALLVLTDDLGKADTLAESEEKAGVYLIPPKSLDRIYTLDIFLPEGEHYRSFPELLYESPALDTIYFEENIALTEEDEGYNVLLSTSDPGGVENFYRWRLIVNGEPRNEPLDIAIAFDEFVDGNDIIGFQVNFNPVQLNDSVRAEQWVISQRYYDYLFTLQQQTAFVGGLFDPPPAPIKGNVYNVENPDDFALGFFHAAGISAIEGVVEE